MKVFLNHEIKLEHTIFWTIYENKVPQSIECMQYINSMQNSITLIIPYTTLFACFYTHTGLGLKCMCVYMTVKMCGAMPKPIENYFGMISFLKFEDLYVTGQNYHTHVQQWAWHYSKVENCHSTRYWKVFFIKCTALWYVPYCILLLTKTLHFIITTKMPSHTLQVANNSITQIKFHSTSGLISTLQMILYA